MNKLNSSVVLWLVVAITLVSACTSSTPVEPEVPTISEVAIGTQVWMTSNLDVALFRNGDSIPHADTYEKWEKAATDGTPAWCYYDNNSANGRLHGKLYNWYAVTDPRGLAPEGYHIPTDDEWTALTSFLGGEAEAGVKMKSTQGWMGNGNGTNSSGFHGLPSGFVDFNGLFYSAGELGHWWSSTVSNANLAWKRYMGRNTSKVYRGAFYMGNGFSVRCIKD
ncbi:MAG: fibrobacter succinogenes major paralogous domain-containing protein [Candidatus Kapaibacteriota bacterium]